MEWHKGMKARLNPLIERLGTGLFGVDQYADIFEKLALSGLPAATLRALSRRSLAADLADAQILFIHVPKNGGTSIKRALYASDPGHATVRYYDLFFPEQLESKETLAILREPTERFLSGFDFLLNGGGGDVRIQRGPMRWMGQIRSIDALLDFLERASGDWLKVDTFVRPQWWYIADRRRVIRVRHLWLLEEGEGLARFLGDRATTRLPHANRTKRTARHVSPEQLARLQRLYAEDYALYDEVRRSGGHSDSLAGRSVSLSPEVVQHPVTIG
jgi:hypothetical protein